MITTKDRQLCLKPVLVLDNDCMDTDQLVEKTDHLTPHLDPFGAYLMSQLPI